MAISSAVEAVSDVVKPYIDRIFRLNQQGEIVEGNGGNNGTTGAATTAPVSAIELAERLRREREVETARLKAIADAELAAEEERVRLELAAQQQETNLRLAREEEARKKAEADRIAAQRIIDEQNAAKERKNKAYVLVNSKKTSSGTEMTYKIGRDNR